MTGNVEVTVPLPDPPAPAEPAPDNTVVVTGGNDGPDAATMQELLDLREFKANVERDQQEQAQAALEAQATADAAAVAAAAAVEIAQHAAEEVQQLREGEQESAEHDTVPQREHGWFAPIGGAKDE